MRTTFALFQKYEDAQKAVDKLLEKKIDKEDINIIAQKSAVENAWNINERTIDVDVTDAVGKQTVRGLDAMLGRQKPIRTQADGDLYAAGKIANLLTKTSSTPGQAEKGLKGALIDFGIDQDPASVYHEGIRSGGLLVFVRTPDERAAEVNTLMDRESAKHINTFGA